jgi:uncharacterized membrane protein
MAPSKRLAFIDLLRGWAVIVMIETHVTNATIIPALRDEGLFDIVNFINGLVAPSFLFASGMAYAVTTRRKIDSYLTFGAPLFRQFGRLLFVLLIGYSLHLPRFNLYRITHEVEPREWLVFFQSDVLQCIAVSLLALQVLLLILRTERRLYRTAAGIAVAIVALTPVMRDYDFLTVLPAPIAAYLNGSHHSLFPLFPWMAFLFAGAVAGYLFAEGRSRAGENGAEAYAGLAFKRFLLAGAVCCGVCVPLLALGPFISAYAYWPSSPSFVLLRIGIVLLLCGAMYWYEQKKGVSAASPVTLIGRESLLVYSVHLLLIYGKFAGFNFRNWINHTSGYGAIALWTIALILLMLVLAWVWERIKQKGEPWKRGVQLATLTAFILIFVFGPGE